MRVFVTGATGFIGSGVARALRERGDEVRALVRSPERATGLRGLGCELVTGDLHDVTAVTVDGCDAVVHGAAVYRVASRARRRRACARRTWEARSRCSTRPRRPEPAGSSTSRR